MINPPAISSPPRQPHARARALIAAPLAAGLVLVGAGGGALAIALASRSPTPAPTGLAAAAASVIPGSYAAIYESAIQGVVTVSTEVGATPRRFAEGTGSGVVVDQEGHILTNAHVVSNARRVRVTFHDGSTATARITGVDASDDLAVIQVSASSGQLHPLSLGDSDSLHVGDPALAIGAPFGLSGSLTAGIISGLGRSKAAPNGRTLNGMIQTDASINPGNSGGPLLSLAGRVIGINESIESPVEGSVGVGFAIPINTAKRVLPDLEKGQSVRHPWLGIRTQSVTPGLADALGLKERSGVLVIHVVPGSPAERSGLRATGNPSASDDLITAIDGHALASAEDLTKYLDTKHVGDTVTLQVLREGARLSIAVTLGVFPENAAG